MQREEGGREHERVVCGRRPGISAGRGGEGRGTAGAVARGER